MIAQKEIYDSLVVLEKKLNKRLQHVLNLCLQQYEPKSKKKMKFVPEIYYDGLRKKLPLMFSFMNAQDVEIRFIPNFVKTKYEIGDEFDRFPHNWYSLDDSSIVSSVQAGIEQSAFLNAEYSSQEAQRRKVQEDLIKKLKLTDKDLEILRTRTIS